jgi:exonuclease VII small subunit
VSTRVYDRKLQKWKIYEAAQAEIETQIAALQRDVTALQNVLSDYECAEFALNFSDDEIQFE